MEDANVTGIQPEGTPIEEVEFGEKQDESEKETTEESSTEENQTEEPASPQAGEEPETGEKPKDGEDIEDDSNVPFHKDPKVQNYISRQVQRELGETLKGIKEGQDKMVEALTYEPPQEEPIPQWFTNLYATGNKEQDQANWRDYKVAKDAETEQMFSQIEQRMTSKTQREREQLKESEHLITSQVEEMKVEGTQFDDNALKNFLVKHYERYGSIPVTGGVIDMRKGLQLMRAMAGQATPDATARKQVAAKAGTEKSAIDSGKPEVVPISKRSWFSS